MSPRKYWPNKKEMEEIMPVPLGTCRYRIRNATGDSPYIEQGEVIGAQLFYHPPANPVWRLNIKIRPYGINTASHTYGNRMGVTTYLHDFTDDLQSLLDQIPPPGAHPGAIHVYPLNDFSRASYELNDHLSHKWTTLGPLTWKGFNDFCKPVITEKNRIQGMASMYGFQAYYRADDKLHTILASNDFAEGMESGVELCRSENPCNIFIAKMGIAIYYINDELPVTLRSEMRLDRIDTSDGRSYILTATGIELDEDPSDAVSENQKRVAPFYLDHCLKKRKVFQSNDCISFSDMRRIKFSDV